MKKILLLGLIWVVVGCGSSKEKLKFDELREKIEKLQIEVKPLNAECNSFIEKYEIEHNKGDVVKALEFANQSVPSCSAAKKLNEEIVKLSEQTLMLLPYLKESEIPN
ncbi:hypothetical protein ABFP33_11365 [Acinetobacter bereziniae]|uniref:hypothetical protein n=1 Tax=Acinetobacter bereziniae TaxID=106648 RepID=UPI002251A6A3|nr:hypothetical protein [Acinetobacter bereziniae]MDA3442635.1 hypothetical protein [Acinetobacter bereziniae]MDV8154521.1 hypothetical protein [Acinetobacter bereziniae]